MLGITTTRLVMWAMAAVVIGLPLWAVYDASTREPATKRTQWLLVIVCAGPLGALLYLFQVWLPQRLSGR